MKKRKHENLSNNRNITIINENQYDENNFKDIIDINKNSLINTIFTKAHKSLFLKCFKDKQVLLLKGNKSRVLKLNSEWLHDLNVESLVGDSASSSIRCISTSSISSTSSATNTTNDSIEVDDIKQVMNL